MGPSAAASDCVDAGGALSAKCAFSKGNLYSFLQDALFYSFGFFKYHFGQALYILDNPEAVSYGRRQFSQGLPVRLLPENHSGALECSSKPLVRTPRRHRSPLSSW